MPKKSRPWRYIIDEWMKDTDIRHELLPLAKTLLFVVFTFPLALIALIYALLFSDEFVHWLALITPGKLIGIVVGVCSIVGVGTKVLQRIRARRNRRP